MSIPVSVIIVTKNEARRIARCIEALSDFDEILVVDSRSSDDTQAIARSLGAMVVYFEWDGRYPKKRQWCLDTLSLKHDWVFFVDADEVVTRVLVDEIRGLDFDAAGYFVKGRYVRNGKALKFGLKNNKLALFDRRCMAFPVVNDLDIPGMGEIEGHYQPVLKRPGHTGQLQAALLHYADEDEGAWTARHQRYAAWERGMNARDAWPVDPNASRQILKRIFRALPGRGVAAFLHCYVFKLGFMDGFAGLQMALSRYRYYRMI